MSRRPHERSRTGSHPRASRSRGGATPAERRRIPAELAVPALGVVLALGLRLLALRYQPWVTIDGTDYIRFAEALARGIPYVSPFPPGYPALIAIAQLLVSDRVMAASLVSLACGALLPLPVWFLARRVLGARWAWAPVGVVALHPELARFSSVTMSESPYLLFLYGGLALAAAIRPLASGLMMGLAFAIRPEALAPAALLAGREAVRAARERRRPVGLALLTAGFLACAVPCWLSFHATLGEWTLTPKIEALRAPSASWRADEPRVREAASATERFGIVERIVRHGPEVVAEYPANVPMHVRSLLVLWPLPALILSAWGLARRRGVEAVPLAHLGILPLLALSEQPRFLLPLVPALAILASVPLARASRPVTRMVSGAALSLGLAWTWFTLGRDFVLPFDAYLGAERDAGAWLSGASNPGDAVEDRKPYVAFYANRPYEPMPDEPYDTIVQDAVDRKVRFLVLAEGVVRVFRPQMRPLLYDREFRERERRLELEYVGGHIRGYDIFIFRVLRPDETPSGEEPRVDLRWLQGGAAAR